MKLLLGRLYTMQSKLDKVIYEKHGLEPNGETYAKLVVALQVEMCELANELRFFKFWSTKGPSDRVLAEYVDVLHFFLSIGNMIDAQDFVPEYPSDPTVHFETVDMTTMFAEIMKFIWNMYGNSSFFIYAFMAFLDFGYKIGLKWDDIVAEYEKKNKENHQRQASGY